MAFVMWLPSLQPLNRTALSQVPGVLALTSVLIFPCVLVLICFLEVIVDICSACHTSDPGSSFFIQTGTVESRQ